MNLQVGCSDNGIGRTCSKKPPSGPYTTCHNYVKVSYCLFCLTKWYETWKGGVTQETNRCERYRCRTHCVLPQTVQTTDRLMMKTVFILRFIRIRYTSPPYRATSQAMKIMALCCHRHHCCHLVITCTRSRIQFAGLRTCTVSRSRGLGASGTRKPPGQQDVGCRFKGMQLADVSCC